MLSKIKNLKESKLYQYAKDLKDVRLLGLLTFGVLAVLVAWSSIGAIQVNYELQQQIARLEQENDIQRLKNDNLRLRNQYYNTDQYLELAARRNFGLAAPGETVILVPDHVALSKTIEIPSGTDKESDPKPASDIPVWRENMRDWLNFFLNRRPNSG